MVGGGVTGRMVVPWKRWHTVRYCSDLSIQSSLCCSHSLWYNMETLLPRERSLINFATCISQENLFKHTDKQSQRWLKFIWSVTFCSPEQRERCDVSRTKKHWLYKKRCLMRGISQHRSLMKETSHKSGKVTHSVSGCQNVIVLSLTPIKGQAKLEEGGRSMEGGREINGGREGDHWRLGGVWTSWIESQLSVKGVKFQYLTAHAYSFLLIIRTHFSGLTGKWG